MQRTGKLPQQQQGIWAILILSPSCSQALLSFCALPLHARLPIWSLSAFLYFLPPLAGHQRSWFIRQVKLDTQFLQGLNVLDYSLLVAFQPLHADELSHNFASIITRTAK